MYEHASVPCSLWEVEEGKYTENECSFDSCILEISPPKYDHTQSCFLRFLTSQGIKHFSISTHQVKDAKQ